MNRTNHFRYRTLAMRASRKVRRCVSRNGATAVEFAIAAPILFLLLFASIEFSRANMLVNTAAIAATEAARASIIPGATADDCRQVCRRELSAIGVTDAVVLVQPEEITDDTTQVTVSVSIPVAENGYFLARYFLGSNVAKTVTLQREGKSEAVHSEPSVLEGILEGVEDRLNGPPLVPGGRP